MSALTTEIIGNALALWCIVLIAQNSVWNWPVGILNCIFYIALFFPAKLYGDCLLQVVYIVLSLFGLYQWLFGRGGLAGKRRGLETERPITHTTGRQFAGYMLVLAVGSIGMGWLLGHITDTNVPYWDGATTAGCLVATWILAYRKIENWWVWIGTNVSYFFLYRYKGLHITQWCQIVFLATSVAGYRLWIREWKASRVRASSSASSSPSMAATSIS